MRIHGPCRLKRTATDQANAIILTFSHRWCEPLLEGKVHVVFRKQGPRGFSPELMYVYASAPASAIIARVPIVSYQTMSMTESLSLASRGCIDLAELRSYGRSVDELVVMKIGSVSVARTPVACALLADKYNFWPSSTFIPLSATGVKVLDTLGQFRVATKGTAHDR
jgi:predicted transcriptional regulator